MKLIYALIGAITLSTTLSAQDLDGPRTGTKADTPTPPTSQTLISLLTRIQEAENRYFIEQTGFAEWRWEALWLIAEGFDFRSSSDAYAAWVEFTELSAAEQAAFHEFVADSRQRMIAVGLN